MFFRRLVSDGLAHYSYLLGDGGEAIVVDPRRDVAAYIEVAQQQGLRIVGILETHRHEDFVVGSVALSDRCGAPIWHADGELPYEYGEPVTDGRIWRMGGVSVRAIETPGHTPGSVCYLVERGGSPWAVMTGDALFAGDVGRVDLPDPSEQAVDAAAQSLYEALTRRILPLGDGVLVMPAHGAGSPCGTAISDLPWTTLGIEREGNPMLALDSEAAFVEAAGKVHERPPYFRLVEPQNLVGVTAYESLAVPPPLSADEVAELASEATVLDVRSALAYAAGHIPDALGISVERLASLAGWNLDGQRPIVIVPDERGPDIACRTLSRMGFENVVGYLRGGFESWLVSGREMRRMGTVTVSELCRGIDDGQDLHVLDVRSAAELQGGGAIPGSQHIHVTQMRGREDEVPTDQPVVVFCGSGIRAAVAASVLERAGHRNVRVVLGGLSAWRSTTCPLSVGED